ncbi:Serine/Threonine kinase domain protein (macronuclear) [Tetrahymena thermophila SB210]|uniref:Serine/Threonine kinase domain protein n=1 Tax=Tetrahymena thermophila (strain SB210) TaxID=312017 RepID=Q22RI5_TETTS|nr:Serine/Threonine kinase domain protein [Tetrahymena thermophila SB210]EAR88137.2 Serine/Threonine kinase domain protein [Tetrahymena thermophila SB210]|eukprot:XP_001008382.2 Serine/Threonine kinase domain protein [Tetrahymena thermophila SB210]
MGTLCAKEEKQINQNEVQEINIRNSKMPQEKINLEHFEFIKCIGTGSFGKVYLVKKKQTEDLYAMKILRKDQIKNKTQLIQTKAERYILENVDSPFVVQLAYAFQSQTKLYIVMEFCQGGDIFGHMVKQPFFPENKIKFYAAEIFLALEKLHEQGIVYRDLKPENILVSATGHIKLTDFGLSKKLKSRDEITYSFCGTAEYMAPEIISKQGHDVASDWWSFGAVLYEMLHGAPPFYEKNKERMMDKLVNQDVVIKDKYSKECQSLLRGLLTRDKTKRLGNGPEGTQEIRNHPFFNNVDWDKFLRLEVQPPYIPKVSDKYDLRNIDNNFLKMDSKDTPGDMVGSALKFSKKNEFNGFTYERGLERSYQENSLADESIFQENPNFILK